MDMPNDLIWDEVDESINIAIAEGRLNPLEVEGWEREDKMDWIEHEDRDQFDLY